MHCIYSLPINKIFLICLAQSQEKYSSQLLFCYMVELNSERFKLEI